MDCKVNTVETNKTELVALCGKGKNSNVSIVRYGLEITELAVSQLPANPNAIWTLKKSARDQYHTYIVVSFINATLVLKIDENVEEVTDSGFLFLLFTIYYLLFIFLLLLNFYFFIFFLSFFFFFPFFLTLKYLILRFTIKCTNFIGLTTWRGCNSSS